METYPSGLRVAFNSGLRQGATRKLVWSDEFDGSALAPENWFAETGDGSQYGLVGWGNNELQWYQPDNARIVNGKLVINVRQQKRNGYDYTSARIITRDRFAFRYGRIEARIRLPEGQGLWSAFWLLPQDKVYGGWAASGEIDIMEAVNQQNQPGNKIHGTIHFGGPWPDNQHSGKSYRVAGNTVSKYHVYALEWDKTGMRWYVDGNLYSKTNAWSSSAAAYPAPFDQPFYILLNVAVGGELPGAPDASAELQADMAIDYVRIYSGD